MTALPLTRESPWSRYFTNSLAKVRSIVVYQPRDNHCAASRYTGSLEDRPTRPVSKRNAQNISNANNTPKYFLIYKKNRLRRGFHFSLTSSARSKGLQAGLRYAFCKWNPRLFFQTFYFLPASCYLLSCVEIVREWSGPPQESEMDDNKRGKF